MASESDPFTPPYGKPGFDINGDQRGRIIGTCAVIIVITTAFVFLRLLSRKLSKAGLWVSTGCLSWCCEAITDGSPIIQWDDYFAVVALVLSSLRTRCNSLTDDPRSSRSLAPSSGYAVGQHNSKNSKIQDPKSSAEIPNGYGRHIYIWHPDDMIIYKKRLWLKGLFIFELFFHTSTTLSKFSM